MALAVSSTEQGTYTQCEKNEKFTPTENIFREIKYLVTSFVKNGPKKWTFLLM